MVLDFNPRTAKQTQLYWLDGRVHGRPSRCMHARREPLRGSTLPTRHGRASRLEHLHPLPGLSAPADMRAFLSPSAGPAAQVQAISLVWGTGSSYAIPRTTARVPRTLSYLLCLLTLEEKPQISHSRPAHTFILVLTAHAQRPDDVGVEGARYARDSLDRFFPHCNTISSRCQVTARLLASTPHSFARTQDDMQPLLQQLLHNYGRRQIRKSFSGSNLMLRKLFAAAPGDKRRKPYLQAWSRP